MTAYFPSEVTYTGSSGSIVLTNRKPDRGLPYTSNFNVNTFVSQSGYSKRTLKSRKKLRSFSLTYTNISGYYKNALEAFFDSRFGNYEAFYFDLSYINLSGTISVCFGEDGLNITKVQDTGDEFTTIYTITFTLNEVYQ